MFLRFLPIILFLAVVLSSEISSACQYNVRDVGFVELSSDPYQLYLVLPDATEESRKDLIESVTTIALMDTNVDFELRTPESAKAVEALAFVAASRSADQAWAAVVSPDGRAMPVDLAPALAAPDVEAALQGVLDRLVQSPKRDALREEAVDKFGVVLLLEGGEAAANQRAAEAIQDALTRIHTRMKMLPKAIAKPPVLMRLSPEEATAEPVLLWSLGLEGAPSLPTAVLLYSRVRRMGPNIVGDDITAQRVEDYLGVVGADCECGLDRKWMQGSMLPIRWEEPLRERLAAGLGFDPEDPMVKTEISILVSKSAKGGAPGARGLSGGTGNRLGYSEVVDNAPTVGAEEFETDEAAEALPPSVAVMAIPAQPTPSLATDSVVTPTVTTPSDADSVTRQSITLFPVIGLVLLCSVIASVVILWRANATHSR